MQQFWIGFLLSFFCWSLSINARAIRRGSANETLLVGQINGPPGGAARNLLGMLLSMNVFSAENILHSSIIPITTSTFPISYSIVLTDSDFALENIENFDIVTSILQPAYIYEANVKVPNNDVDTLSITVRTIKFVIIRGEIVHDKHEKGTDLPGKNVKLELIDEGEKGQVIDQVDFLCTTTKYPCPFEYWLDTSHIKENINYKLEGILANRTLPARKSVHQKHNITPIATTKSSSSAEFKINPAIDTEINNYTVVLIDAQ